LDPDCTQCKARAHDEPIAYPKVASNNEGSQELLPPMINAPKWGEAFLNPW